MQCGDPLWFQTEQLYSLTTYKEVSCTCSQAQDFKPVGEQVLAAFHEWIESGAGGAANWSLAEVNHEGWRVGYFLDCPHVLTSRTL